MNNDNSSNNSNNNIAKSQSFSAYESSLVQRIDVAALSEHVDEPRYLIPTRSDSFMRCETSQLVVA